MNQSHLYILWAFQVVLVVKNLPANAGDTRDTGDVGLIPGSRRSPGEGHDNLLQYSCLENPMDRGAWRATVHRVTKSQTRLKQLSTRRRVERAFSSPWSSGNKAEPRWPKTSEEEQCEMELRMWVRVWEVLVTGLQKKKGFSDAYWEQYLLQ